MRMLGVSDSTNIAEVGYDPDYRTLDVVFVAAPDVVYTYHKVGMVRFVKLVSAPSIGNYFKQQVEPYYGFTKRSR